MSFYQPSLSLYDVLNALAGQAQDPNRDATFLQDQEVQKQRDLMERQARARAQSYCRFREPPMRSERGYPFHKPHTGGLPGQRYGLTSEPHYYRPLYYYNEEDDSDEDDVAGVGEEETGDTQYVRIPSYYHSRAPKNTSGKDYEMYSEQNDIQDLLSNLFGIAPPISNDGVTNIERNEVDQQEGAEERKPLEASKDGHRDTSESSTKTSGKQKEASGLEPIASQKRPNIASMPALQRKISSLHQQIRSPTPDPLQVSKPETRLDLPFSPEINVYDRPEAYFIAAALPGATSKNFKVDYHPSSHELIIKGNLEDKLDVGEEFLKITELKYGAFQRTLKFPVLPRLKDDEIKATYKNGLLQVKVPKIIDGSEKPAPKKRISIEDVPDEELEFEENPNPVQG